MSKKEKRRQADAVKIIGGTPRKLRHRQMEALSELEERQAIEAQETENLPQAKRLPPRLLRRIR